MSHSNTVREALEKVRDAAAFDAHDGAEDWSMSDRQMDIAEAAINALIREARKEGYIEGGIEEILRHEKARQDVEKELK